MRFRIDAMKAEPVFQQLVNQVKKGMAHGQLKPGDRLPTVREMAAELLVNPNTVQKAYQELIRDGLIFSRKGMGNFITSFGDIHQRSIRAGEILNLIDHLYVESRLSGLTFEELESMIKKYFCDLEGEHTP